VGLDEHLRRRPGLGAPRRPSMNSTWSATCLGEPDLVGHDHHRPALVGQGPDHPQHVRRPARGPSAEVGSFEESISFRLQRQRPLGDADPLLLPAGQLGNGYWSAFSASPTWSSSRRASSVASSLDRFCTTTGALDHVLQDRLVREQVCGSLGTTMPLRARKRGPGVARSTSPAKVHREVHRS